jgi:hypothetical protein
MFCSVFLCVFYNIFFLYFNGFYNTHYYYYSVFIKQGIQKLLACLLKTLLIIIFDTFACNINTLLNRFCVHLQSLALFLLLLSCSNALSENVSKTLQNIDSMFFKCHSFSLK